MALTWEQTAYTPASYTIDNSISNITKATSGWTAYGYSTEKGAVDDGDIRFYDIALTGATEAWIAVTWFGDNDPTLKTPLGVSTVEEKGMYYGVKPHPNVGGSAKLTFYYNGTADNSNTDWNTIAWATTDTLEIYSDGGYMKCKKNGSYIYTWTGAIDTAKQLRTYFTMSGSGGYITGNTDFTEPPAGGDNITFPQIPKSKYIENSAFSG